MREHLERMGTWMLFLLGGWAWGDFFSWGRFPLDFHDWTEIAGPRLAFLQNALQEVQLPLHMAEKMALRNITDRYLAIPDLLLSPQVVLLGVLDLGYFVLINALLCYALGFWGLLRLKKRFQLSFFPFSLLFLMTLFNGHLQAHIAVGHSIWIGALLLPWFVLLVLDLLDGDRSWAWAARMSAFLFLLFLQGAYHPYAWALMFLGCVALFRWSTIIPVLKAGVFTGLLSAVRITPAFLNMGEFDTQFQGGYPGLPDLWAAVTELRLPGSLLNNPLAVKPDLGWWEMDLYVGLAGGFILLLFIYLIGVKIAREKHVEWGLLGPVVVLGVISMGRIYEAVRLLPIPIISGERVSSRIMLLPFIFLVVWGAKELQAWKPRFLPPIFRRIAGGALLSSLAWDLWRHLQIWKISRAIQGFEFQPFDAARWTVANYGDGMYLRVLLAGLAISLGGAGTLALLVWRERRLNRLGKG